MTAPGPWAFLLLALAAFRLWRILARDSITEKAREKVTGFADGEAPPLRAAEDPSELPPGAVVHESKLTATNDWTLWEYVPRWRIYLSALIRCAWCSGFYVSLAVSAAWWAFPHAALLAAFPLALSSVVGLLGKLDKWLG